MCRDILLMAFTLLILTRRLCAWHMLSSGLARLRQILTWRWTALLPLLGWFLTLVCPSTWLMTVLLLVASEMIVPSAKLRVLSLLLNVRIRLRACGNLLSN